MAYQAPLMRHVKQLCFEKAEWKLLFIMPQKVLVENYA